MSLIGDRLTVRYGDLVALNAVSVSAEPGTMTAVTGPSGAGKTTLLWALAGAREPDEGTVNYAAKAVTDRVQAAGMGISLIPQGNGLVTSLTAQENVLAPLLMSGVSPDAAGQCTTETLTTVGLEDFGTHLIEELSGGQQQRVAVARGLAGRPGVLLADEPTSELDQANRQRVIDALRAHAATGAIVVMSTHDPEAAAQTDAIIALDQGCLRNVRATPSANM